MQIPFGNDKQRDRSALRFGANGFAIRVNYTVVTMQISSVAALVFLVSGPAVAQKVPEPLPVAGGTVTGRVLLGDTGGPARFAKVLLKSAAPPTGKEGANPFGALLSGMGDDDNAPKKAAKPAAAKPKLSAEDEAEKKKAEAASAQLFAAIGDMMVSTTVGADGVYTFTNVKAGTYYVHATAAGYIDPFTQFSAVDLASTDAAMRARIAAAAPTVTISGTGQAKADLRLDRGGSIGGRVLYDDGSPAAGWIVRTVHDAPADAGSGMEAFGVDAGDLDLAHASETSTTDDTGHFRIAGLASGEYVLQARLTAPALGRSSFNAMAGMGGMMDRTGIKLTVYSGNTTHKAEAKALSLRAGDDRSGYDLTVPLRNEHTVGGMVRAKSDGHPISGGTVELTAQDAAGKEDPSFHLVTAIRDDGTFRFDYVPGPATYTLKANHAVDVTTTKVTQMMGSNIATQKTNHTYGSATATTMLGSGDVTDVKLDVPEVAVAK